MPRPARLLLACAGLLAAAPPAVPASGSAATMVLYVAPVDGGGTPLPALTVSAHVRGHCEVGSDSVPGPVYRCFYGNFIIDPCWAEGAHPGVVLCMPEPWSRKVVELNAGSLARSTQPVPSSLSYPWGVQLANGERCLASQGAHDEFHGRVVDYACGHSYRLVLLRGMHSGREPWSFDSAIWNGKTFRPGPTEHVRTAWYGGPAPDS